jgi:hypothetical protein
MYGRESDSVSPFPPPFVRVVVFALFGFAAARKRWIESSKTMGG